MRRRLLAGSQSSPLSPAPFSANRAAKEEAWLNRQWDAEETALDDAPLPPLALRLNDMFHHATTGMPCPVRFAILPQGPSYGQHANPIVLLGLHAAPGHWCVVEWSWTLPGLDVLWICCAAHFHHLIVHDLKPRLQSACCAAFPELTMGSPDFQALFMIQISPGAASFRATIRTASPNPFASRP